MTKPDSPRPSHGGATGANRPLSVCYRLPFALAFGLLLLAAAPAAAGPADQLAVAPPAPGVDPPRLERHRLASPSFDVPKNLLVYLPPDYDPSRAEPYPVIYFLHGLGNSPEDFESRGAAALTDRLIREGRVPSVIVALPSGAISYYVNQVGGGAPYEDHVRLEAPQFVEQNYPVRTDPAGRAISGISMGGFGALKIALRYPREFGSASAHTPFLMKEIPEGEGTDRSSRLFMQVMRTLYGDPIDPAMWAENNPFDLARRRDIAPPPFLFTAASEDRYGLQIPAHAFHEELEAQGVPHVFVPFEGVHGWESFQMHWESMLNFHARAWSGAPAETAAP